MFRHYCVILRDLLGSAFLIYIYLLTYLLHGAESFLNSWLACS